MIFAEVKSPVRIQSGADKDNFVQCLRAEFDFLYQEGVRNLLLPVACRDILLYCKNAKGGVGNPMFEVLLEHCGYRRLGNGTRKLMSEFLGTLGIPQGDEHEALRQEATPECAPACTSRGKVLNGCCYLGVKGGRMPRARLNRGICKLEWGQVRLSP